MPAFLGVVKIDALPDARADFIAGDVAEQQVAPAPAERLGRRQQRRHHHRRHMPAHMRGRIVEIEHVRCSTVNERGVKTACAPVGPENQARPVIRMQSDYFFDYSRGLFHGPSQRNA